MQHKHSQQIANFISFRNDIMQELGLDRSPTYYMPIVFFLKKNYTQYDLEDYKWIEIIDCRKECVLYGFPIVYGITFPNLSNLCFSNTKPEKQVYQPFGEIINGNYSRQLKRIESFNFELHNFFKMLKGEMEFYKFLITHNYKEKIMQLEEFDFLTGRMFISTNKHHVLIGKKFMCSETIITMRQCFRIYFGNTNMFCIGKDWWINLIYQVFHEDFFCLDENIGKKKEINLVNQCEITGINYIAFTGEYKQVAKKFEHLYNIQLKIFDGIFMAFLKMAMVNVLIIPMSIEQTYLFCLNKDWPIICIKSLFDNNPEESDFRFGIFTQLIYLTLSEMRTMLYQLKLKLEIININIHDLHQSKNYTYLYKFLNKTTDQIQTTTHIKILPQIQSSLYRVRHDVIVHAIRDSYNIDDIGEYSFRQAFELQDNDINLNKTPDIIINTVNLKKVIEVTVSTSQVLSRVKKRKKYEPIINLIEILLNKKIEFTVVSLSSNLSNLAQELKPFILKEGMFTFVNLFINRIMDVLYKINMLIGTPFDASMPKHINIEIDIPNNKILEESMRGSIQSNSISNVLNILMTDSNTDKKFLPKIDNIHQFHESLNCMIESSRNNYKNIIIPKPTLHFVLDPSTWEFPEPTDEPLNESKLVLDFFSEIHDQLPNNLPPEFAYLKLVSTATKKISNDSHSKSLFLYGEVKEYTRNDFNKDKETNFENIKNYKDNLQKKNTENYQKQSKPKFYGYIDTLEDKKIIKKQELSSHYKKAIKMSVNKINVEAREFYVHAGINAKKEKNFKQTLKDKTSSLDLGDGELLSEMQTFINQSVHDDGIPFNFPDFVKNSDAIPDHQTIMSLKRQCHAEFNPILDKLSKTKIFKIAYRYSLFAKELFMLGSFLQRKGHTYIFSTGLKNIFCLVLGQSMKRQTDPGIVFCFIGLVKEGYQFSSVFGDIKYLQLYEKTLFISNWRRLKRTKLAFMSDVFFSTLSSASIDLSKFNLRQITINHLIEYYAIRVISGLNSSQKNAEMLLDFKYMVLGSLSKYANLIELFPDKFGPYYSNHLSIWLVHSFFNYCKKIILLRQENTEFVHMKKPVFYEESRVADSVGGFINLPAFWVNDLSLKNFEHFLSGLHTYVHTPKEPNSLFFEGVKCINTIWKFKQAYLQLDEEDRQGYSRKINIERLCNSNIGFSSTFLYHATLSFLQTNPFDAYKILNSETFRKPVCHFTSTKASIETFNRPEDKDMRMKVHDVFIIRPEICHLNLLELCQKISRDEHYKPLADMCIKEQYGAKREFYVLDIESKLLCKMLEEFFKKICQSIPTECISVPGDLKLIKMQENINKVVKHAHFNEQKVYYINGDCTKWSASEVMESFQVVLFAHKEMLPKFLYDIFLFIFERWKIKELQIPTDIRSTITIETEKTEYLFCSEGKNYRIKLEQNFLMGIFNYFSSYKASIVYEYMKKIIERQMPDVYMLHLEHSDDYAWAISCKASQIHWIKTKITKGMKFGSISDSDKKTTVSEIYCEFVSLFGFNGHMVYPNIKKTKEISSALTGEGFQSDSAAVCSRTSELVRTGCTMVEALFFHKIHNWQLANLYSLLPGQRNFDHNYSLFNKPVEFFGLSEIHPLLYFINNGDVNNLRLYKFCPSSIYLLQILCYNTFTIDSAEDVLSALKKPTFTYHHSNLKLNKRMTKLDIKHSENIEFLNEYPVLQYYKPYQKDLLIPYLKSFYSLKSFQKAYEPSGRFQILLRIAFFTSKKCILFDNQYKNPIEINTFLANINKMISNMQPGEIQEEFLTNGDTSGLIFYGLLQSSSIKIEYVSNPQHKQLMANQSPFLYNPIKVDTPVSILLLKKYSEGLYILENPYLSRKWDIDEDMKIIDRMDDLFKHHTIGERINIIYKRLTSPLKPIRAMMLPFGDRRELLDFIRSMFKEQSSSYCRINLTQIKEIEFSNPLISGFKRFRFNNREIPTERAIGLTLITIYSVLKFSPPHYNTRVIQEYFNVLETIYNMSALSFIKQLSPAEMRHCQYSKSEISSMMIMKTDLCPNLDHLQDYFTMYSAFCYKYLSSGLKEGNKWIGDTIADFTMSSCNCRVEWYEEHSNFVIICNKTNPILSFKALTTGMYLIQKIREQDLKHADPTSILDSVAMNLNTMKKLFHIFKFRNRFNKEINTVFEDIRIMVTDDKNYCNFVNINSYHNEKTIYYPIFYIPKFKIYQKGISHAVLEDTDFEISVEKGVLMTKPNNWIISKFGISNFWADLGCLKNTSNFTLGGLKLEYLLTDNRIEKALTWVDFYFKIHEMDENFIRSELELQEDNEDIVLPLCCNYIERGHVIMLTVNQCEIESTSSENSNTSKSENSISVEEEKEKKTPIGLSNIIQNLPSDCDQSVFTQLSRKEITDFNPLSIIDTAETGEPFSADSEMSSADDLEGFTVVDRDDKPQDAIFLSSAKNTKNWFLDRFKEKPLWIVILDKICRNTLVDGYRVPKFWFILFALMGTKFPDFMEQISDPVYKVIHNNCLAYMYSSPVANQVEFIDGFRISLRLDKTVTKNASLANSGSKIIIRSYKFGYINYDKFRDKKNIIVTTTGQETFDAKLNKLTQCWIEKDLNTKQLSKKIKEISEFYQDPTYKNFKHKHNGALLYTIFESKLQILDQDLEDWIDDPDNI